MKNEYTLISCMYIMLQQLSYMLATELWKQKPRLWKQKQTRTGMPSYVYIATKMNLHGNSLCYHDNSPQWPGLAMVCSFGRW